MKRVRIGLLIALCLAGAAAVLDWLAFAEEFGLWTYTLGTFAGLGLGLLGLLMSIGRLLFARRKGLSLGPLLILIGVITFLLALLVWIATGRPIFR